MTGIVAALHAVVTMRGYSRICGATSLDVETGSPRRSASTAASVRSFFGFA